MNASQRLAIARAIAGGYATTDTFRDVPVEAVREIKASLPFHVRGAVAPSVRVIDLEKKVARFRASVQIVDRMGDVIVLRKNRGPGENGMAGDGWLASDFHAAGGPFLWNHNASFGHALPPIGQVLKTTVSTMEVSERGRRVPGKKAKKHTVDVLLQDVRFVVDDAIPFSKAAFLLVRQGVIRGVSVGWVPELVDVDDVARKELGVDRHGVIFRQSDQIELSLTPTPANPMALLNEGAAASKALEAKIHRALVDGAKAGEIERSLVDDFVRTFPLGADDARRRLAEKLRSVVDVAATRLGAYAFEVAARIPADLLDDGGEQAPAPAAAAASTAPPTADPAPAPYDGPGTEVAGVTAPPPAAGPEDDDGDQEAPGDASRAFEPDASTGAAPPAAEVWHRIPWGGIGAPVVRDVSTGAPVEGARVHLEQASANVRGPGVRFRVELPDGTLGRHFELVGPCDADVVDSLNAANEQASMGAGASEVPRGTSVALDAVREVARAMGPEAWDRFGRAAALNPAAAVGVLVEQARAMRTALASSAGGGLTRGAQADLWTAFEKLSEGVNLIGRALDEARGLPGADEQSVDVVLDSGVRVVLNAVDELRGTIAGLADRLSTIESTRGAVAPTDVGQRPPRARTPSPARIAALAKRLR